MHWKVIMTEQTAAIIGIWAYACMSTLRPRKMERWIAFGVACVVTTMLAIFNMAFFL